MNINQALPSDKSLVYSTITKVFHVPIATKLDQVIYTFCGITSVIEIGM